MLREAANGHDHYILLAQRYQWLPDEVDRQDPNVIADILTFLDAMQANDDEDAAAEKKASRAKGRKGRQAARRPAGAVPDDGVV